jgi:hypothetical protein
MTTITHLIKTFTLWEFIKALPCYGARGVTGDFVCKEHLG